GEGLGRRPLHARRHRLPLLEHAALRFPAVADRARRPVRHPAMAGGLLQGDLAPTSGVLPLPDTSQTATSQPPSGRTARLTTAQRRFDIHRNDRDTRAASRASSTRFARKERGEMTQTEVELLPLDTTDVDNWMGLPVGGGQLKEPVRTMDIRRW